MKKLFVVAFAAAGFSVAALDARAVNETSATLDLSEEVSPPESAAFPLARAAGTLAGAAVLLAAAAVFLKKSPLARKLLPAKGAIEILGKASLGPRTGLGLAKVGERVFLVGLADAQVNLLAEFRSHEIPLDSGVVPSDEERPALRSHPSDFSDALKKWMEFHGN